MIMSHGYNTVACGATGVPGTVAGNGVYPASYGGHHATTAHQSMAQQQHQHLHMQQDMHQLQHKQIEHPVKSSSPSMHSGSDPFSPGCGFGAEDEFDIPALPAASMDDPPPHPHQAHYYGGEAQMMASQQNAMYHHHPMYAAAYGQHQHYGGQYDQYAYGYGSSGQMYHSGGAHQAQASSGCVMPGGPSPGGSHNTPSPQAHSEDGDVGEHIRNNNVLKTGDVVGYGPGVSAHHVAVAHQHHVHHVVQKKPKVSKRKKKRDPNEPQKPVSAYALFFRDSQAAIKVRNPNAAFGDVSKIVASLWDALDPDNKAAYKKRTETAKKEYLKKLAAYRATLVSMGNLDGSNPYAPYASSYSAYADIATMKAGGYMATAAGSMGQPIPPRPPMQQHGQQQQGMQQQQGSPHMATGGVGYMMQHQQHNSQNGVMIRGSDSPLDGERGHNNGGPLVITTTAASSLATTTSTTASSPSSVSSSSNGDSGKKCGRPGCRNVTMGGNEFCSNECVVGQCREVYSSWSGSGANGGSGGQTQQQQPQPRPPPHAAAGGGGYSPQVK